MKRLVIRWGLVIILLCSCGCSTRDMAAVGMGLGILSTVDSILSDAAQDKRLDKLEQQADPNNVR